MVTSFHQIVIAVVFTLVILPFVRFFVMVLYIHKNNIKKILYLNKEDIKKIATHCIFIHGNSNVNYNELPNDDIGLIIDHSIRENATVIDT